jgi:UDP-N-acetylmuramoyl-L-alanyl-D-glutamate--2,6-diaminopimelate ligase
MHPDLTVGELADAVNGSLTGRSDVRVSDIEYDSRRVRTGTLFVAIRGFVADGHEFVRSAVDAGASAVCVDHQVDVAVPQVIVGDTRAVLGPLSAALYGYPSRALAVIGVTGTNGKTTVTHFVDAIARSAGARSAIIGTIGAHIGDTTIPLERTTPEAPDLQRLLARMRREGVGVVAMEVSSHSLVLHRIDGTGFAVAAFTNLSQDHLDFHHDMESYFAAKAGLFEHARHAVIFVDDPFGARLASSTGLPTTTVGFGSDADLRAASVTTGVAKSSFTIVGAEGSYPVALPVGGVFNVANALVAAGCAVAVGIPLREAAAGLGSVRTVRGRFEIVSESPVAVIVDYAHTPDGIKAAIDAARAATTGRITVVFGAGGDRDHRKRPLMGAAASNADTVMLTNDNPRSEDPASIAEQVASGITASAVLVQLDRRKAIFQAVELAEPGDTVLILGKGHETTQVFADRTVHFDDREVAREALGVHS